MNKNAMTLSIGFSGNTNVHCAYIPGSRTARSHFKCMVNLTRNSQTVLQSGCPSSALPLAVDERWA